MNTGVHLSFHISDFIFFSDMYPAVELLNHMAVLFLVIWRTSILFSIVVAPTCNTTNIILWFPFLHVLANICYLCILIIASFDRYEVLPCGFSLHFSHDSWYFLCALLPFVYLLMNNVGLLFKPSAYFLIGLFCGGIVV